MEEDYVLGEDLPLPPARLFERLAQIPGYTWDQSFEPFHSSYDNWHVYGIRHIPETDSSGPAPSPSVLSSGSNRSSPKLETRPSLRHHWSSISEADSDISSSRGDPEAIWTPVIARISTHVIRLEREFHANKSIIQTSDPECKHTIRPIDLLRLASEPGDAGPILVSVFESPGPNYLREVVNFGPAFYAMRGRSGSTGSAPGDQIPLQVFLDFAIGACECLELLHHGHRTIHGEIRADALHFNLETGTVKLVNAGNGPRSFENSLTTEGWSTLSKELGAKNKLQFIAPEQTGRMPTEPDSRTDIYSLGVVFWALLVGKPAFDGSSPVDVIQNVLSRRIPLVSSKRMDVPDVISLIIQKMTQKQIDERYHSISGLKHDLIEVQKLLGDGDVAAIKDFKIGRRDVSSFFILPAITIGRKAEHEKIIQVIEKVLKKQQTANGKANAHALYSISSNSSISESRVDSFDIGEGSSDSSSHGIKDSRSNSTAGPVFLGSASNINQDSKESVESGVLIHKPSLLSSQSKTSINSRGSWDTVDRESHSSYNFPNTHQYDALEPMGRGRGSQKFRRRGRCEVISILGAAGLGKTALIQRVQPTIRKHGYFALAKFDRARQAPFEPLMKAMSSLFRQIFSERDVSSNYHNVIRASVRSIWGMLHSLLGLPENLLAQAGPSSSVNTTSVTPQQQRYTRSGKAETPIKDSTSTHSGFSSLSNNQSTSDFLRGPASTKSLRFMNTFLEVLRVLSHNKLICLCLEDLQYADEESLDLIMNIVKAKIRIVLMVSSRQEDLLPSNVKNLLETENASLTKIELSPLSENDVLGYVAATMHTNPNMVVPLAAVIQEKTQGNPFYIREALETCYRKNCIYYSWKDSAWEFNLDRVFTEFTTEQYGQCLNTSFVTKRLQEMSPAARSIMAWASLLGSTFSFTLIQRLLRGEFLYSSGSDEPNDVTCPRRAILFRQSEEDAVAGLQLLLQSYILIPGESDDEFRFSHDRYAQAAASMRECHNVEKMHYLIAKTLMKYSSSDEKTLHLRARHICLSANLIRKQVSHRIRYRDVLYQAALGSTESGARRTALKYYRNSLILLQDNPWDDKMSDVFYEETLQLHVQTAEFSWYQGYHTEALSLLSETFTNARTPSCKIRSWILQSRVFAQRGDSHAAFQALRTSLAELGLPLKDTSWDDCDIEYKKLASYLREIDLEELLSRPLSEDRTVIAMGTVMVEAMSAAFWSDSLIFFNLAIHLISVHLFRGTFIQIGLGYSHFAMIAICRFKDMELGMKLGDLSKRFLDLYDDPWTRGRGWTIHTLCVAHLQTPIRDHLQVLENALDYSYTSGDRIISLINLGAMASARLYIGQDMAELEAFCSYVPEEFTEWSADLRGGVILLGTKQFARALQGKTWIQSAETIMSDEQHDTQKYMAYIAARASNSDRPYNIYWGMALTPLYLFGYHEKVVEVGQKLVNSLEGLWSMRCVASTLFYLSLSMLSLCRDKPVAEQQPVLETVREYKRRIDCWGQNNDNYTMWSLLLEAEIADTTKTYQKAVPAYEAAIDHSQVHGFAVEEALAIELQGEFFNRKGAKRAARAVLLDAIAAWNRISATGKAKQVFEKNEWLLKLAVNVRTNEVGCQTSDSLVQDVNRVNEPERNAVQSKDDRTRAWLEPHGSHDGGKSAELPGLGLDIIDLSSILEFSQVISSELQIDSLLTKMTEIILESAGGQADFAAIVIDFEDQGWCVAASGDQEHGVKAYPEGLPFSDAEDQVAQQIAHYVLRFKETVFVHNILDDERFSNCGDAYLARNPLGKSIIALPIIQGDHLLGVIHLEGAHNSFTQRNLVVLHLLCNQVGISIANALLFTRVRKVSASNASMIESQKRALAQARESETKAKIAEAEAKRMVRLKEEAAKAKSMFLANVSHELRTPLNGVIGMSELLKGTVLNNEQEEYADSIRVCADTLLTVINDILDFSKLEAGKMKMFSVPLNLRETITEVVRALGYMNLERELKTVEDLDLDPNLLVLGDPVRLHQIFMNLLSNSYKFTPTGSVTVRAKADHESRDKIRITCSVADTGIGISPEQLAKLFKPFSQADSSTARSYGGSGLGLSICKAMIENVLGGKIWLESAPEVGTTVFFTLTFPKAPKDATATTTEVSAKDPDPMANWSQDTGPGGVPSASRASFCDLSSIPRDEIRICIAEDNPINQKIAVSFVSKLGLKCEAYSDGKQAVDALRLRSKEGTPFHLVLMDIQMPVLDGYDATRAIRRDEDPHVREVLVIAMTASAIRGDREKCLEAGMNNYLAKPVRAQVLKAMLNDYLSQSPKQAPNLLADTHDMVKEIVREGTKEDGVGQNGTPKMPPARKSRRTVSVNRTSELSDRDVNARPDSPSINGAGVPQKGLENGVAIKTAATAHAKEASENSPLTPADGVSGVNALGNGMSDSSEV